jgi:hypothetical protein
MILIYEGFPTNQKAKVADVSKFGRAVSEFTQSFVIYAFVVDRGYYCSAVFHLF